MAGDWNGEKERVGDSKGRRLNGGMNLGEGSIEVLQREEGEQVDEALRDDDRENKGHVDDARGDDDRENEAYGGTEQVDDNLLEYKILENDFNWVDVYQRDPIFRSIYKRLRAGE